MAESSIFWTTGSTGDGATTYTQTQLFNWLRRTFTTTATTQGVMRGYGGELAVTGTSSPIAIASGAASVYGIPYESTASENKTITTPSVGTTGFRVVLRANWTAQTVRITVLVNTDGVSAAPAVTQTPGTTYDISLATGTITTGGVIALTDARDFIQFNTNHVRRTGDTMTGALTINLGASAAGPLILQGAAPALTQLETDVAANTGRWVWSPVNGQFWGAAVSDDTASLNRWIEVSRSGITITGINFPVGSTALTRSGNTVWDAGNDGSGSGLDADLLDGIQSTGFARLAAASNFTTAPTINGATIFTTANDGSGSGLDADLVRGQKIQNLRRQGGNASFWDVPGTSNYTPATILTQVGSIEETYGGGGLTAANITVNFGVSFTGGTPIVTANAGPTSDGGATQNVLVTIFDVTATDVTLQWRTVDGSTRTRVAIMWQAIGPTT